MAGGIEKACSLLYGGRHKVAFRLTSLATDHIACSLDCA